MCFWYSVSATLTLIFVSKTKNYNDFKMFKNLVLHEQLYLWCHYGNYIIKSNVIDSKLFQK